MVQQGVLTNGDTLDYAHGLTVTDYRGLPTFGHGGSWVGYRTNFVRFPEQNLSIAVFCNVSDCDPAERARSVAEVYIRDLLGPEPEDSEPEPDPEGPELTAEALQEYAGSYRSPELDSTYDLEVDAEGRLVASHWRNDPTVLSPTGADTFTGDQWFLPERSALRSRRRGSDQRLHRDRRESARPDLRAAGVTGGVAYRCSPAWRRGRERRPSAGIARERETSAADVAPYQGEGRGFFMTGGVCRRNRSCGFSRWGPEGRRSARRKQPRMAQTSVRRGQQSEKCGLRLGLSRDREYRPAPRKRLQDRDELQVLRVRGQRALSQNHQVRLLSRP